MYFSFQKNPKKHSKYYNYDRINLEEASRLVSSKKKKMSVRGAAERCGVPESTLRDKLVQRHPKANGSPTALSFAEEEALSNHLIYMAECGYGLNRSQVKISTFIHILIHHTIHFKFDKLDMK